MLALHKLQLMHALVDPQASLRVVLSLSKMTRYCWPVLRRPREQKCGIGAIQLKQPQPVLEGSTQALDCCLPAQTVAASAGLSQCLACTVMCAQCLGCCGLQS